MKIMFCYDGSEIADRALEKTINYFKEQKPDVILLTVSEAAKDSGIESEAHYEQLKELRDKALKSKAQWVAEHGMEVDCLTATGDPREMILAAIEKKDPDIVVVARRGMSDMRRMALGSVSAYLVRHSERPVLVMTLKKLE